MGLPGSHEAKEPAGARLDLTEGRRGPKESRWSSEAASDVVGLWLALLILENICQVLPGKPVAYGYGLLVASDESRPAAHLKPWATLK